MGEGITFLEKYFRTNKSIIVAICLCLLACVWMFDTFQEICLRVISMIGIIGITAFYIVDTSIYNKLPVNKNENAILLRIIAKDKNEYEDVKYKFGSEFEKYIKNEIKIIYIPYHLVEKNKFNEEDKIIKLLQKTNCMFLITVKTRSENVKENIKYITEFNLGIIHPKYNDNIENLFQKEFNILGMPLKKIEYSNEDKLNVLEITAQRISFVCRYIIARAYYLINKLEVSKNISEPLFKELNVNKNPELKDIKQSVANICYDVHLSNVYFENKKDDKNIDYIEKEIEEANKFKNGTYTYFEVKSVCAFLKDRDIKKAYDCLGNCKKIRFNAPWKYSEAFLRAYTGENEGRIMHLYKQAFKVTYNIIDLIDFIEDILKKETDKNMLRFALVLLYIEIGNEESAKELLKEYLENKQQTSLNENTIKQLIRMFGQAKINKLIEAEN